MLVVKETKDRNADYLKENLRMAKFSLATRRSLLTYRHNTTLVSLFRYVQFSFKESSQKAFKKDLEQVCRPTGF